MDSIPRRGALVQAQCAQCGSLFWLLPSRLTAGKGRFCGRPCAHKGFKLPDSQQPLPSLPSPRFIAYTAGLFDGEGCLTVVGAGCHRCQITQGYGNDGLRVMSLLRERWGIGKIYHYAEQPPRHEKALWIIDRQAEVAHFLGAILDDLIIKRERAAEFLALLVE